MEQKVDFPAEGCPMLAETHSKSDQPLFVLPGITSDLELHTAKIIIRQRSFISRFFPDRANAVVAIPLTNIRDVGLDEDEFYYQGLVQFTICTLDEHKYIVVYNRKYHPVSREIKAQLDSSLSRMQPFPPRPSVSQAG